MNYFTDEDLALFAGAVKGIPPELSLVEAKDIVLDTCKTPLQMDIRQMRPGLEKWGFAIEDFELVVDTADGAVLPEHMVWLECDYGHPLMKTNLCHWLCDLKDFPWVGSWRFVVKYCLSPDKPKADWSFSVVRHVGHWTVSSILFLKPDHQKPKWPGFRR